MSLWGLVRKEGQKEGAGEHPLSSIHSEIDRVFSDFLGPRMWDMPAWKTPAFPSVNVSEMGERVQVTAEIPGMSEDDVNVTLSESNLVIEGEKTDEKEEEGKGWIRRERSSGSFRRVIALPAGLDLDKAEASYDKGVITVNLPRKPEAMPKAPRKITVTKA